MTKRHTISDDLDPFDDPLAVVDGFDGFTLAEVDNVEDAWYRSLAEDTVFCEFGFGDEDELCVKDRFGCHVEGCEHASPND